MKALYLLFRPTLSKAAHRTPTTRYVRREEMTAQSNMVPHSSENTTYKNLESKKTQRSDEHFD